MPDDEAQASARRDAPWRGVLRGMAGMLLGAAGGYALFRLLLAQGVLALALPGAAVGLGCGLLVRRRSWWAGALSALAAVGLMLWIAHGVFVGSPGMFAWANIAVGAALAFWLGLGRAASA